METNKNLGIWMDHSTANLIELKDSITSRTIESDFTHDEKVDALHMELKLDETEQMNRLLLNSSSDVIMKLSTDWKILEFNAEAEKFFGKKRNDIVGQNFIQVYIPKPAQKKVEKEMKKQLNETQDGKLKLQVMAAGGNLPVVEWSVHVLLNNLKIAVGMILSLKKQLFS